MAESPADYSNYAYITFRESASAYEALKEKDRRGRPFYVQPADTWKQPRDSFKSTDIEHFKNLSDDCLMELFEHMPLDDLIELSEVSVRLNSLIHNYEGFDKIKEVNLDGNMMTVTKLRRTLLAHGKYVESVIFTLPKSKGQKVVNRMVDLFTKHIGDNLVNLEIRGLKISNRMLSQFKRLFERLKVLKWQGWEIGDEYYGDSFEDFPDYSVTDDVDLLNTCVNLEKLTVSQRHGFNSNSGTWQKLTNVHIGFDFFPDYELYYPKFFKNNPQITRLKIYCIVASLHINDIATYLPNLEKLKLYSIRQTFEPEELQMLTTLHKLRILKMDDIDPDTMNFLLQVATTLPELEEIELIVTRQYRDVTIPHLTNLRMFAENAPKTKKFRIKNYPLTDDVIIDMIRHNKCLEVFDICNCEVTVTERLLLDMCDARKNSPRCDSGPIEIVVNEFESSEIDNLLLNDYVSKHIKLVKKQLKYTSRYL